MATALPALMSCSESYPGLNYEQQINIGNNEAENPTPVQVFLEEQRFFEVNPIGGGTTKGIGALENEEDADGNLRPVEHEQLFTFRVFSFLNDGDFGAADLRYSFFSPQGTGGRDARHRHCLIDGYDYDGQGLPAKLNVDRSKELVFQYDDDRCDGEPNRIYYSSATDEELRRGYNFFVYHTDDSEVKASKRESDRISHDIEIDGTQDIMYGASPVLNDAYLDSHFADTKRTLTQEELTMIRNIRGFSSYTAHRGIYPIVQLEHQLARLKFFIYPGRNSNEDNCAGVFIDRITLEVPWQGEFTVAGRQPGDIGIAWKDNSTPGSDGKTTYADRRELRLYRADNGSSDGLTEGEAADRSLLKVWDETNGGWTGAGWEDWDDSWTNLNWKDRPYMEVGQGMLIPPVSDCVMRIYYHCTKGQFATDNPEEAASMMMRYNLPPSDINTTFEKGKVYNINIAIYGPQTIKVNANINNWQFGGDINVGEE